MASWIYSSMCLVCCFFSSISSTCISDRTLTQTSKTPPHVVTTLSARWVDIFMGNQSKRCKLTWKSRKSANISICRLHLILLIVLWKDFFALIFSSSKHRHVGWDLYKWRAEKACGIFDTFATCLGLVHDNSSEHLSSASSADEH